MSEETSHPGLCLRQVTFSYPPNRRGEAPVPILQDVNLDVNRGEIMVLLGPSGCGKSTLLQVVAGLLPADSGTLTWDGVNQEPIPTHRRGFAMLFQDGQLFANRNVERNVGYALELRRPRPNKTEIAATVAEMLQLVRLEGMEKRRVDTLSGGQAGRVALARALAARPKLLLLDEPLSALDEQLKYELAAEIRDIVKRSHITAVYVTHDQAEAALVADRVGIMLAGVIRQTGTLEELKTHPETREVAKFLGVGFPPR